MSQAEINVAFGLVKKFFGGDFDKAFKWWFSSNPSLGGISADDMCKLGREKKLLKWVKQQIAESKP